MVMGITSTEYGRNFKARPNFLRQSWEHNVDYVFNRRVTEAHHAEGPFNWNTSDPSESDRSASPSDSYYEGDSQTKRPKSVPPHQAKHQKYSQAYTERLQKQIAKQQELLQKLGIQNDSSVSKDSTKAARISTVLVPKENADRQVQTPENWNKLDLVESPKQNGQSKDYIVKEVEVKRPKHPVKSASGPRPSVHRIARPCRKPVAPVRPMSAPLGRSLPKPEEPEKESPPPFLPYGYRDSEREVGVKKTHNILASSDVYPAALRASRRRKVQVEEKEQMSRAASLAEKTRQALFNAQARRDNSVWDTEYRKNYAGYSNELYQHNLQNRLNPRHVFTSLYNP